MFTFTFSAILADLTDLAQLSILSDASSHLSMRRCPSVGRSVGWPVGNALVKIDVKWTFMDF